MAQQLLVDLYGCDAALLDDPRKVATVARTAIRDIGADVVEEVTHRFEPMGVTYIAVITTSHLSIHTWPELGYAALDVFSCSAGVPDALARGVAREFDATSSRIQRVSREIGRHFDEV